MGAQVASGYMPGDTLPGCCASVSSSFSTFLYITANWAGVDKNIRTTGAKQVHWPALKMVTVGEVREASLRRGAEIPRAWHKIYMKYREINFLSSLYYSKSAPVATQFYPKTLKFYCKKQNPPPTKGQPWPQVIVI
jgi:hypothetical protein